MGKNGCRFLSLMTHEQKMLDVVCKICIEAKVKLIIDKYKTSILPRLSNIQRFNTRSIFKELPEDSLILLRNMTGNLSYLITKRLNILTWKTRWHKVCS